MGTHGKSRHKNHYGTSLDASRLVVLTTIRPSQIPVQPRNSTIQCFLFYRLSKPMLPFTMRSVSILALFTGSVSCALRSRLGVSFSVLSVLRTQRSVCPAFFATLFFSVACTLLVSLAPLFRPRPLCFQWLSGSFSKSPGGVPPPCSPSPHPCLPLPATWTPRPQPTILSPKL